MCTESQVRLGAVKITCVFQQLLQLVCYNVLLRKTAADVKMCSNCLDTTMQIEFDKIFFVSVKLEVIQYIYIYDDEGSGIYHIITYYLPGSHNPPSHLFACECRESLQKMRLPMWYTWWYMAKYYTKVLADLPTHPHFSGDTRILRLSPAHPRLFVNSPAKPHPRARFDFTLAYCAEFT